MCVPESADPAPLLNAARTYAFARDFRIVAECVDTSGRGRELVARTAWADMRAHLTDSTAQGLIVSSDGDIALTGVRWADAVAALRRPDLFVQCAEQPMAAGVEEP
ncbi:hypothetical protein OG413_04075 [Streptomyces sp. NBC_01433]|uniref:hypothetical protein n=1 Tax=Streptomyces sp. NBC_01433 TaxID=2903864 RepID=UPI00224F672C|nr:hypothetical protein [Streptomyces sp. NBC_01433]MCX4674505.1 hypothetical protein [Streptomyces sp. NBC_01433]